MAMIHRSILFAAFVLVSFTTGDPADRATEPPRFRVLSFNILQGGRNAANVGFHDDDFGGSRHDDLARVIELSRADIVGVQELYSGGDRLLKELGTGWSRGGTILSKFEITPIEMGDHFSIGRVHLPGGRSVIVANVHWWPRAYGPSEVQKRIRAGTIPSDLDEFERQILEVSESRSGSRGYDRTLNAVKPCLAAGEIVIITGDFNEPSHLDWTARAVCTDLDRWVKNSSDRPLNFEIQWRGSKLLEEAGFRDAYRTVFADETAKPGNTWTPPYRGGTPGRCAWEDQILVRIDMVYFAGKGIRVTQAAVIGENEKVAEIVHRGPWPSDHRAVLASFEISSDGRSSGGESRRKNLSEAEIPESAIARNLNLAGIAVAEEDHTIWGASPLRHRGKIHLYVARWPEPNVDPAWRKSSEIAHYVADEPEGPFEFVDVSLTGTGEETWDRYSAHNPEVRFYEKKFVLLYVSNSDYRQPPHPLNQRIGMATAPSPAGPWTRVGKDGLILESAADPSHWSHGSHVVNPALLKVGDKYHLYFKSKCRGQRGMVYGVAVADSLEGPYRILGQPLTSKGVVIEDGAVFEWGGKICLLTTDNHGSVTGIRGGGALWVSDDGLDFRPEWTQIGYGRIPCYFEGYAREKVTPVYGGDPKFERPKILSVNDRPAYLYAPSGWNVFGGKRTVLHVLRIDLEESDSPLRRE